MANTPPRSLRPSIEDPSVSRAPCLRRKPRTWIPNNTLPCPRMHLKFTQSSQNDDSDESHDSLMHRLQIEHDVEASLKLIQKEQHEKRMRQLRQLEKVISDTDWQYDSVDKLIGLR